MTRLWGCVWAIAIVTSCRGRDDLATRDASVVESGPPSHLQFGAGGVWVYQREIPKRATVYFDNATKEIATIRMPTGESIRVSPGGTVPLSTPIAGFVFDRVREGGAAERVGPFSLTEGRAYIYDIDAVASYEITAQSYSNLGVGSAAAEPRRIAGAFLFETKEDFVLAPFPDKVPMKNDEAVATRTAIQRTFDGNPTCTRAEADAGAIGSRCALGESEWTVQVRGEGDAPSATVYVDNAYATPIELRVDQLSVATLKAGSLTRIHLSPQSHVLGAYDARGTLREATTQSLGEWKNYVWTPEKRRNFTIESRDYGTSFRLPGLEQLGSPAPTRLNAPGFFETDADFLFVPFPDSITASTYTVGATRKRLARVGAP